MTERTPRAEELADRFFGPDAVAVGEVVGPDGPAEVTGYASFDPVTGADLRPPPDALSPAAGDRRSFFNREEEIFFWVGSLVILIPFVAADPDRLSWLLPIIVYGIPIAIFAMSIVAGSEQGRADDGDER